MMLGSRRDWEIMIWLLSGLSLVGVIAILVGIVWLVWKGVSGILA